jgi:hypothetical protein
MWATFFEKYIKEDLVVLFYTFGGEGGIIRQTSCLTLRVAREPALCARSCSFVATAVAIARFEP